MFIFKDVLVHLVVLLDVSVSTLPEFGHKSNKLILLYCPTQDKVTKVLVIKTRWTMLQCLPLDLADCCQPGSKLCVYGYTDGS